MAIIHKAVPVGGLTKKHLEKATATEDTVANGYTFYAGDRELRMGTASMKTVPNKDYWYFEGTENKEFTCLASEQNGVAVKESNHIHMKCRPSTNAVDSRARVRTTNLVDVSEISTIYVKFNYTSRDYLHYMGIYLSSVDNDTADIGDPAHAYFVMERATSTSIYEKVMALDVTDLAGEYYIYFAVNGGTGDGQTNTYGESEVQVLGIYTGDAEVAGTSFMVKARATKNTTKPTVSNVVTNTDNYTTVVIDSVIPTGGNYGESRARLYIDGVVVLDTGKQSTTAKYKEAASTWSGSFPISQNGTVYADVYTTRDSNIDGNTDPISITVNFHFEGHVGDYVIIGENSKYTGGLTLHEGVYLNAEGSVGSISTNGLYDMTCVGKYGHHAGAVNVYSNQAIDLTPWQQLTITYLIHDSTINTGNSRYENPEFFIVLADNIVDYTFDGHSNSAHLTGQVIFRKSLLEDATILNKTVTETINISTISGSYYLDFYAAAHADLTACWDITGLVLS